MAERSELFRKLLFCSRISPFCQYFLFPRSCWSAWCPISDSQICVRSVRVNIRDYLTAPQSQINWTLVSESVYLTVSVNIEEDLINKHVYTDLSQWYFQSLSIKYCLWGDDDNWRRQRHPWWWWWQARQLLHWKSWLPSEMKLGNIKTF